MEFYIVNEFDKPCPRHVTQLIGDSRLDYIHTDLRGWEKKNGVMVLSNESTNLKDFGFTVRINQNMAIFTQTSESIATYCDGTPRRWQDTTNFQLQIK